MARDERHLVDAFEMIGERAPAPRRIPAKPDRRPGVTPWYFRAEPCLVLDRAAFGGETVEVVWDMPDGKFRPLAYLVPAARYQELLRAAAQPQATPGPSGPGCTASPPPESQR